MNDYTPDQLKRWMEASIAQRRGKSQALQPDMTSDFTGKTYTTMIVDELDANEGSDIGYCRDAVVRRVRA